MKILVCLLLFVFSFSEPPLQDVVRSEYYATKTEGEVLQFLDKWKDVKCTPCQAYVIAAEMERAIFTSNVASKFRYFNAAKAKLDDAIAKYPNILDFRFIRFRVQTNIPKIANYSRNIQEDFDFIKRHQFDPEITQSFRAMIEEHIIDPESTASKSSKK